MNVWILLLAVWGHPLLGSPQWLLVQPDQTVRSGWGASALAAEAARSGPPGSIWIWSYQNAPTLLPPGSNTALPLPALGGPAWLEVRVVGRVRPEAGGYVLAAPLEMWREVPEGRLPRWPLGASGRLRLPVRPGQAWRIRFDGEQEGSWWVDLQPGERSALLRATPARPIAIQVLEPGGRPAEKVRAFLNEAAPSRGESRTWAQLADGHGQLTIGGLPDEREIALTVLKSGSPPLVIRAWPSTLPRQVTLPPGAEIAGRLLRPNRQTLARATVEAEAWVPQTSRLIRLVDETKADGSFRISGVPAGRLSLTARAPGFAPLVELLEIEAGGRLDLGTRVLEPAGKLRVSVVDGAGNPVAGATVEAGAALTGVTDRAGRVEIEGIPSTATEIRGTAFGYLPGSLRLQPPFPLEATLELRRGFVVRGRLLGSGGRPVPSGAIRIEAADCSNEGSVQPDGIFEQEFQPGKPAELVLTSPATRELRLDLAPGTPGEVRDLGDLRAPLGGEIAGTAVEEATGEPVAGARIWLLRPGPQGPAVAWGTRDFLETRSDAEGRFRLAGLDPGRISLRVEAGGFARATLEVDVPGEPAPEAPVEVGLVRLLRGVRVEVEVDSSLLAEAGAPAAFARIDLARRWLAADQLSAQVWNGKAEVPHVPPGAARVSVLAGRRVFCEQDILVPETGVLRVDCAEGALLVVGRVTVGDSPAGPGVLTWKAPGDGIPARIDNQVSPGGVRQQQVYAAGREPVDVPVEANGGFQTRDLSSGPWRVYFQPRQGSASPELNLEIPPGERFEAVLPFAGHTVEGIVTGEDGEPAAGAAVTDLRSGAFAVAGPDGSFLLAGLAPGEASLQARKDERSSEILAFELNEGRTLAPQPLVLGRREPLRLRILVKGPANEPAAGAMVFLEEEGKGIRLVMAGADGTAQAGLEPPLPPRVRMASSYAGKLALGDWQELKAARAGLSLRTGQTGGIQVTSRRPTAPAGLVSPAGWDVAWLFRLLGLPLEAGAENPLLVQGLPPGLYTLTLGKSNATADVRAGELAETDLQ